MSGDRSTTEENHRAAERSVWRRQLRIACWLNIITLGGVIAACAGLIFVYLGLKETRIASNEAKRAADIASDSLVAANRAWLTPVSATMQGPPDPDKPFGILVKYGNIGKEPALGFVAQEDIGIVDTPTGQISLYDLLDKARLKNVCGRTKASKEAVTTYPSGLREYSYSRIWSMNEFKITPEIASGHKIIFVNGCFAYFSFGQERKSEYCFLFIPDVAPQTFKTVGCPYGNRAE